MYATIANHAENETALAVYACPTCKGSLAFASQALHCDLCRRTYLVRNYIPDFISGDLRQSKNFSLRHSTWFDWLAPIYETSLWYPVVMRLAGAKGVSSLPQLLTTVDEMMGTVAGDVLDVACGPGTFGRRVAMHSRTVYGVDISFGMLEQGRTYAQREHLTNLQFARAGVEALPFASETFAAALCCGSLHLFEDTLLALREIARTMQTGASLAGFTFTSTDTRFSRFAQRHGARFFELNDLGSILRKAGFEEYSPRTFGSALVFAARKTAAPTEATH